MTFLSEVAIPNRGSATLPKSNFIASIGFPTLREKQLLDLRRQAEVASTQAQYAETAPGLLRGAFQSAKEKTAELLKTGYEALTKEPLRAVGEAGVETGTAIREGKPAEALAGALKLEARAVGGAFAPISAAFAVAEKIPTLKPAAQLLSMPFEAAGITGQFLADRFVDVLPVKKDTKNILRPALKEVGSLVGQIWLGGKIIEGKGKGEALDKAKIDVLKEEAKNIIPPEPPDGGGGGGFLATVQRPGEIVPERILPTEGVPTKPSKVGLSIEQKAIEEKLTRGFEKTAEYTPITIKEQAQKVIDLMTKDIEAARKMLRGEEPLSGGIDGTSLIVGMEEYAKRNPSADIYYELANSPYVTETSKAGQTLRIIQERTPDSATAQIQQLRKYREEKVMRATKKTSFDIKKEIKESTKQNNLSKEELNWDNFLAKIEC